LVQINIMISYYVHVSIAAIVSVTTLE